MLEKIQFKSEYARRIPDPNFKKDHGTELHSFFMRCVDLPPNIGDEPNARTPNIKKLTYRRVAESLLEADDDDNGTFHLKNKGITIIAKSVKNTKGGTNDDYTVELETGKHGIVDGGHTYKIIQENNETGHTPEDQYVRVDIRVGVPDSWIPMISGGLNTAVQVDAMSLENLKAHFGWIKEELNSDDGRGKWSQHIAWEENEGGTAMDAKDLIAIMCLLNPILFPNDADQQPIIAYSSKEQSLKKFMDDPATFKPVKPILRDMLILHDTIASTAYDLWNKQGKAKAGLIKFFWKKKKSNQQFPFIDTEREYRLLKPAVYPILAAFRCFTRRNELTNDVEWIVDFSEILNFWQDEGRPMLETVHSTLNELGYSLTSLGKNGNLWITLHSRVGVKLYQKGLMK